MIKGKTMTDILAQSILARARKQLEAAAAELEKGGRPELARRMRFVAEWVSKVDSRDT